MRVRIGSSSIGGRVNIKSRLPDEYQRVEYVEGTGTQYIDTGVTANINLGVNVIIKNTASYMGGILGENSSYAWNRYGLFRNNVLYVMVCNAYNVNVFTDANAWYNIDFKYPKLTVNNQTYNLPEGSCSNGTIDLFRMTSTYYSKIQMKKCKMYIGDTVIRDFIPCYRKSDGEIGMYDVITKQFFTNQGTGTFLKGSNVVNNIGGKPHITIEGTTNLGGTSVDYSNRSYGQNYTASCWGGDQGTVTFFPKGGYNDYPYKVYHKTATGTGGIFHKTDNDIKIEAGKTYTMSVYVKASRNFSASQYSFNINRGSDNKYITYNASFPVTTEWKRLVKTFTATNADVGMYGEQSILYDDGETDYYVYYSGFQIEEKDHATPFVIGTRPDNTII